MCNTSVILAQLGEHGACNLPSMHGLPIQPANSSDRFLLSSNTLADLGHNQGGTMSTNQATHFQWCPPRDTKNCDVCYMQVTKYHPGSYMLLMV